LGVVDVQAGDVGGGKRLQHAGRKHHEEVRAEGVPLHGAETGHAGADRFARHVERDLVAELQPEFAAELLLDRDLAAAERRFPETAGDDPVVGLQGVGPAQVGVAPGPGLPLRILEFHLRDVLSVDGRHARANQWHEAGHRHFPLLEKRRHRRGLLRLDVDQELVGRVIRQALPPGVRESVRTSTATAAPSAEAKGHLHHARAAPGDAGGRNARPRRGAAKAAQD
jgi:hypothetical protein